MTNNTQKSPIVIIGAMDQEIEILVDQLEESEKCELYTFEYYRGHLDDQAVIVAKSDIGKVNTAVITSLLINTFQPKLVINTGSAGGLAPHLNVGDVIIGERFCYHDVDVRAFDYDYGQVPGQPKYFASHPKHIEIAEAAGNALDLTVDKGLICSGDSFISDQEKIKAIQTLFPEILAVEMESTAVAQTCERLNVHYLIIRSISDNANDSAQFDFYEFLKIASKNSAQLVLHIIAMLQKNEATA